ncbi:DUF2829 domain-containing protein [Piscinibacter gummiphilus]|uniref:DUF2829 domain-containing protein n=1 Tax=Piscinibacter gummiphilus TaxID=946333 RepID=A0ABZ0CNB7_9BURK|nr:DUF2829 domain-containing protein [Piscinibacter gummiphilus]WOB06484.1 DUF2829 domain-containing protein [Piscinibacter gummiphilus]
MTHKYIGTKEIVAWPQTRDVKHPADTQAMVQDGYAVKYPDGYISWSPKEVFEQAYRRCEGDGQALTFGDAIHFLKLGHRVARAGWNGKGMFVYMVRGSRAWNEHTPSPSFVGGVNQDHFDRGDTGTVTRMPNINMHAADGSTVTGWLASQTDMLADDWMVLPQVAAQPAFDPSVPLSGFQKYKGLNPNVADLMSAATRDAKAAVPVEYRNRVVFTSEECPGGMEATVRWKYTPPGTEQSAEDRGR